MKRVFISVKEFTVYPASGDLDISFPVSAIAAVTNYYTSFGMCVAVAAALGEAFPPVSRRSNLVPFVSLF